MTGIFIELSSLLRAIQVPLLANIKTKNHRQLSLFFNLPDAISVILVKLFKRILNIVMISTLALLVQVSTVSLKELLQAANWILPSTFALYNQYQKNRTIF